MFTPSPIVCDVKSASFGHVTVQAHRQQHVAGPQRPALQGLIQRRPQPASGIRQAALVAQLLPGQRDERGTLNYQGSLGYSIESLSAAVQPVAVAAAGVERRTVRGVLPETQSPAEVLEQSLLE